MASYSTMAQLRQAIMNKLEEVINDLTNQIYEKLLEFIDSDIYDTYTPVAYERTYEFRDKAWEKSCLKNINAIVSEIFYNGNRLTKNPLEYAHVDSDKLAEILNRGYVDNWRDWDFGRTGEYPKPYFTDTLNWIKGNWNSLVRESLVNHGFNIK